MTKYKFIHEKQWIDVHQKLQKLNTDINSATEFVREIENGNLDVSFDSDTTDSELKTSLASMRDQMKTYSLTEKQRNWVNEGLAKFVQILRSGNKDGNQKLSDSIISNLIEYLKANQGALFTLNDDDPDDPFLEMEACYAYSRKKFLEKRIKLGEGLAGQVVLEKSTIYMTNVPVDFIKITSGLGEALPRNIMLVPLKLDDKIYGVVEIASFQLFQPYEIEFVEKLGESIASTIAAVKGSERTNALLKETQIQTEQLRAQEEEVRQNLEELSATQESMQRAIKEIEAKEFYIIQLLNATEDLIYTVDKEFRISTWNKAFARTVQAAGAKFEKGTPAFEWVPEERKYAIEMYKRALGGETFEVSSQNVINGKVHHFTSIMCPLKSDTEEIFEVAVFVKNITAMIDAQQQTELLLKESQQQAEELKAQEEELRQNMEELSATQDAMEQKTREVEDREEYLKQLLNTSQDVIFTVDKDFRLVMWNESFAKSLNGLEVQPQKGMVAFEWRSDQERLHFVGLFKRVFKGESFETRAESRFDGNTHHFLSAFAPLRNSANEIVEAAIFSRDITVIVEAQQQAEMLLKESQQQAEELKAQEEELRQNMEELSATQEAFERAANEAVARENYITNLINVSKDVIFTVDRDFKLVMWNEAFARSVAVLGVQPQKGMLAFEWRTDKERLQFVQQFKKVFKGETVETSAESKYDGKTHHFIATYTPLRNNENEIVEVAAFGRDITATVDAQQQTELLLKESQQQAEELKAQEEELRQNMEELAATQEHMVIQNKKLQESEEVISTILNSSPFGIIRLNDQGTFLFLNQHMKQLLGVSNVNGSLNFSNVFKVLKLDKVKEGDKKRTKIFPARGNPFMAEVIISSLQNDFLFFIRDVTSEIKQQLEIVKSLEQAEMLKHTFVEKENQYKKQLGIVEK